MKDIWIRRSFGAVFAAALALSPCYGFAAGSGVISFRLKLGKMANYGANPWYTDALKLGNSPMKLIFDSGANFIWATSDKCNTPACTHHERVNTKQRGFTWINPVTKANSFGPWGTMQTWTGAVAFRAAHTPALNLPFFASVDYSGAKFRTLAWGGGIGLPSESDQVQPGSASYFTSLYASGALKRPEFSMVTDVKKGRGHFYLGGEDRSKLDPASRIVLPPQKNEILYLWGTLLYGAKLGKKPLPSLSGATFYLDSGSSEFKGDRIYLGPILKRLYRLRDHGQRIFKWIRDEQGKRIGLVYRRGSPHRYRHILPDLTLTMGQGCGGKPGQAAQITLSPRQYSYRVQEGQYKGHWVAAFTVLDGVGGLLVGSTFMDHFYTTFSYRRDADNGLSQGNMYLYRPKHGDGPAAMRCVEPKLPILGRWYNSYCSQVNFTATASGAIRGVYTSHTGSVGSSNVVGWIGKPASTSGPKNPYGTPVALGIQWRLINQPQSSVNGTWHWVSSFSGEYFPAQTVSEKGQKSYRMPEHLELLNMLEATVPYKGLADTVPVMWPEDLEFTRTPPSYCETVMPGPAKPFKATAHDELSGKWKDAAGDVLVLKVDMKDGGGVTGSYRVAATHERYRVSGLADAMAVQGKAPAGTEQGVALTMVSPSTQATLSMAGGVSLQDHRKMELWSDTLSSTTWSGRYAASTVAKTTWHRM